MTISTVSVGAAVTPTVIETWCSHYLNRKPRRQKPTAHISYDVGLNLIRRFLLFAATQTVDDVQAFTSQWVPAPTWIRTRNVDISDEHLAKAVEHLQNELGPEGIQLVGGKLWWQWRAKEHNLRGEWIEMKKTYQQREKSGAECKRCMFYIHGGAYYFGSVDEHRYQMQRHARKLQAKVFAPRYRLGPQYPFPCGLLDCLAAYLYLLTQQPPETIVFAGDSAGGGMVVSLLVLLRDQGLPLPAGGILLSPWVDLTHSFPSCANENSFDYVPSCGFMHKPSMSWPPPNSDGLKTLDELMVDTEDGKVSAKSLRKRAEKAHAAQAKASDDTAAGVAAVSDAANTDEANPTPGVGENLSIVIDGKLVEIKDQIQMYANNTLISHPLVSPVLQASLGGLPPLCVLVGGGEMLRDEQIYLAHKAAHPAAFPPPSSEDRQRLNATSRGSLVTGQSPEQIKEAIERWPPTNVQLQVWDDLCHVAPTLSFTRPAKYMFRSVSQFGAWALARAQKSEIRILDDDEVSVISEDSEADEGEDGSVISSQPTTKSEKTEQGDGKLHKHPQRGNRPATPKSVGRAGDPLPLFKEHMIRNRVTRHGNLYALEAPSELPALTMSPQNVGNIKTGPVKKWLTAQEKQAGRFGSLKLDIQKKRLGEMAEVIGGKTAVFAEAMEGRAGVNEENPPATAWAGRSKKQFDHIMKSRAKRRISRGLAIWSGWGSHHDEETIGNEEEKVKNKEDVTMSVTHVRNRDSTTLSRAGEPGTAAVDQQKEAVPAIESETGASAGPSSATGKPNGSAAVAGASGTKQLEPTTSSQFPVIAGGGGSQAIAGTAPFKLASANNNINPSTTTLLDQDGTLPAGSSKSATAASAAIARSPNGISSSDASKHNSLTLPPSSTADVSRPSTSLSSDAEVVSAQAVPLQHYRSGSRADPSLEPIMARKRFESGVPDEEAAAAALRPAGLSDATKRSSWAESTIDQVRLVGSRDGPVEGAPKADFSRFGAVPES